MRDMAGRRARTRRGRTAIIDGPADPARRCYANPVVATREIAGGDRKNRAIRMRPLRELTRRISTAPFAEIKPGESRALAFIGPPGRGKTTSLIKLAVAAVWPGAYRCGYTAPAPTAPEGRSRWRDTRRSSACPGTPTSRWMRCSLASRREPWKGLLLIDTPGTVAGRPEGNHELPRFFSRRPEIETHLVLRADARSADMLQCCFAFLGFEARPASLHRRGGGGGRGVDGRCADALRNPGDFCRDRAAHSGGYRGSERGQARACDVGEGNTERVA